MIRVLIVVDVAFYREGLQEILSRSAELEIVGAARGVCEAENVARARSPEIALLDINASDAEATLTLLRRMTTAPRVVALAVVETARDVIRWVEAGVAAYVPRTASTGELIQTIKDVAHDEVRCRPDITATLMRRLAVRAAGIPPVPDTVASLTDREHEVLALLANGLPNKAIAARLRIKPATAKNHVHNILHKLDLRGRVEVASILNRERSGIRELMTGRP